MDRPYNMLFISRRNSARSLMAEAVVNRHGNGRFHAFSAAVSDTASREAFPDWPGKPVSSHWRYPDPLKATGDEWQRRREFGRTLVALERQMRVFMQLPLARLDAIALKTHLNEIGIEQAESSDAQTS